jgi:hypothetical protein
MYFFETMKGWQMALYRWNLSKFFSVIHSEVKIYMGMEKVNLLTFTILRDHMLVSEKYWWTA